MDARLGWVRMGLACYLPDWSLGAVDVFELMGRSVADVIGLVSCFILTPPNMVSGAKMKVGIVP